MKRSVPAVGAAGDERGAGRTGRALPGAGPAGGRLRLPPLNALKAFHAVARHKSLRRAGEELLVTPQAVGQQIRLLEEHLGVTLFDRRGRIIEPTESAILLAHFVDAAFRELTEGVRRITETATAHRINLNVSPYFAAHHLLPRLAGFHDLLPGADLRLTTIIDLPDFARDDVDMAVQWGYGDWGNYDVTLLIRDPKLICCTPEIGREIRNPLDLLQFPLLEPVRSHRFWDDILDFLGVAPDARTRANGGFGFDDAGSMSRATRQGMGVGLLSVEDAEAGLQDGSLVAPLGRAALTRMPEDKVPGFYLIVPASHLRMPAIAALHRWLIGQDWHDQFARNGGP